MKFIDLIIKIYNRELKDGTLLKLTYDNWNTIEYWKYKNEKLYYNNEENTYHREDEMNLFSYLHDRNILVEIIEEKPKKIDNWEELPLNELKEKNLTVKDLQTYLRVAIETQKDLIDKVNYLLEKSDKE